VCSLRPVLCAACLRFGSGYGVRQSLWPRDSDPRARLPNVVNRQARCSDQHCSDALARSASISQLISKVFKSSAFGVDCIVSRLMARRFLHQASQVRALPVSDAVPALGSGETDTDLAIVAYFQIHSRDPCPDLCLCASTSAPSRLSSLDAWERRLYVANLIRTRKRRKICSYFTRTDHVLSQCAARSPHVNSEGTSTSRE
jgi:hypothetical protein